MTVSAPVYHRSLIICPEAIWSSFFESDGSDGVEDRGGDRTLVRDLTTQEVSPLITTHAPENVASIT